MIEFDGAAELIYSVGSPDGDRKIELNANADTLPTIEYSYRGSGYRLEVGKGSVEYASDADKDKKYRISAVNGKVVLKPRKT